MKLSEVVPWGRSLAEYRLLFNLSEAELGLTILGCGDGPASFNSEMTAAGRRVVSIDPVYAFSKEQIRQRVAETYEPIISQVKLNPQRYVWDHFRDPDALGQARLAAMERFLEDFEAGLAAAICGSPAFLKFCRPAVRVEPLFPPLVFVLRAAFLRVSPGFHSGAAKDFG